MCQEACFKNILIVISKGFELYFYFKIVIRTELKMDIIKKKPIILLLFVFVHFFIYSILSATFLINPNEDTPATEKCLELQSLNKYTVNFEGSKLRLPKIVKKEEKLIQSCLNSVKGLVDFDMLAIDDGNEGLCNADILERDIEMLKQGLKDEPGNLNYVVYLASSYYCLGDFEAAIKWYKAGIAIGGGKEEIWYCKYMIGTYFEFKNEWEKALSWYLNAYRYNQERADSLQRISRHYLKKKEYELAYFFAKKGSTISRPANQALSICSPVYDYLFDEDISMSAYYAGYYNEGFAAVNRLMLRKDIPEYNKGKALQNVLCYVNCLKDARYEPLNIDLPYIREGSPIKYFSMNPSIRKTENGYKLICRTVNYLQIAAKYFLTLDLLDKTNTIRTRNFFLECDRDFNLLSQQEIIEDLPRLRLKTKNIEGLEDCRLFSFKGSDWFSCTTLDTNPIANPQITLCKLENESDGKTVHVEKFVTFMGPDLQRCEKNWLPFIKDDALHMIYSFDPFIVYKPRIEKQHSIISNDVIAMNNEQKYDFTRFSGSAPPIAFEDGFLTLVHESVYDDQRIYLHRFVFFDPDFNITKVSKPFVFMHKGIEYCCGMTFDHSEENLIMSIGYEDRKTYLCFVGLNTVSLMLEELP